MHWKSVVWRCAILLTKFLAICRLSDMLIKRIIVVVNIVGPAMAMCSSRSSSFHPDLSQMSKFSLIF